MPLADRSGPRYECGLDRHVGDADWRRGYVGDSDREYPWGAEPDSGVHGHFGYFDWAISGDPRGRTAAVGLYPGGRAVCGALDMGGNVWEWCAEKDEGDKLGATEVDDSRDPRLLRGGSWFSDIPDDLRASSRFGSRPDNRFDFVGFRVYCRPH